MLESEPLPGRRRLPKQAYLLLNEYYHTISTEPSKEERGKLLNIIHDIPGCAWYTSGHLSRWFNSHRPSSPPPAPVAAPSSAALPTFPTTSPLTLETVQQLQARLLVNPEPPLQDIVIWADELGADFTLCLAWVYVNRPWGLISQNYSIIPQDLQPQGPFNGIEDVHFGPSYNHFEPYQGYDTTQW